MPLHLWLWSGMRLLLLCVFFCATSIGVHGLYNGNPSAPEIIDEGIFINPEFPVSAKAGYQGDFIFGKKLRAYDGASGRIDTFSALMNQGVVTLNIVDSYEFYGSAGSMDTCISHRPHVDGKRREYETNNPLTWGAGLRAILFRWGRTELGFDGKYQHAHSGIKWITVNGTAFATGATLTYEEWQLGLGLSHHVDFLTPYAAVRYADPHAKIKHLLPDVLPNSRFVMKTHDWWGLSLGCTISSAKRFDLNVEVRLFDEEALTLAGNVKF